MILSLSASCTRKQSFTTGVIHPCVEAIVPLRISAGFIRVLIPKRICKPGLEQFLKILSFLNRIICVALVGF